MMATIWKFPFNVSDRFTHPMPRGAQILHVDTQNGQPCLWALVEPDWQPEERTFRVYGTGHYIDPVGNFALKHVATFQQGPLVWHLFEETPIRTSTGKVLDDAAFEALADEAEAGYDVDQFVKRP